MERFLLLSGSWASRWRETSYTRAMRLESTLSAVCATVTQNVLGLTEKVDPLLRQTTDVKHGDYQINVAISLGKKLGKAPREIAEQICAELQMRPEFSNVAVAGPGFINLTLSSAWLSQELTSLLDSRAGVSPATTPERIVVDFSGPNIAKQMHVGHLRSTIIGAAIIRLLRLIGHDVLGDNHLGDWGTQFGLLIKGMQEWGSEDALTQTPIDELERIYRLASARAKEDEVFAEAARAELAALQRGDEKNTALWIRFVETTKAALMRDYARLDVTFDRWYGESFYDKRLGSVVADLLRHNIAREDQGATCVFFADVGDDVPEAAREAVTKLKKQKEPMIVRKRDGAYLYSSTDIATVRFRCEELDFPSGIGANRAVCVVDARQALHFQQVFAASRWLLAAEGKTPPELTHVAFGTILGEDGKPIKTRDGQAITLDSLLREGVVRAQALIAEKAEEGSLRIPEAEREDAARIIGIGAIKYADLMQNRTSDYRFEWDKLVSFKGNAAPYLQYMYARVASVFRKAAEQGLATSDASPMTYQAAITLSEADEVTLARTLLRFDDVVHRAANEYYPHYVAEHLYQVATDLSRFYTTCSILGAEGETVASRLALAGFAARQIRVGLDALGIDVIEQM